MFKRFSFQIVFLLFLSIKSLSLFAQDDINIQFMNANMGKWHKVYDAAQNGEDRRKWVLDGHQGSFNTDSSGITLTAGPHYHNDSSHVVLWFKKKLFGDVKIEYDYIHLDSSKVGSVNIIYIHAQGKGQGKYHKDIMKWNDFRSVPSMKTYFNNMKIYHISYATTSSENEHYDDYVRARLYNPSQGKGLNKTELLPEYFNTGLFKRGIKYHIVVILRGDKLFMNVKGDNKEKLFWFDVDINTRLKEGNFGFREMWGRSARYENLRIFQMK